MKPSLSYRITMFILKLKGLKKDFSKNPIDYRKIRKQDVHFPKKGFFGAFPMLAFDVLKSRITEINQVESSEKLLIFVHGGAFISGPSQIHWDTTKTIIRQTKHTVWMCDYPKAPENDIVEISANIDAVYAKALEKYQANQISLMGDSVGGTLITALVQRLIENNKELPNQLILVSPVMDSTLSNPEVDRVDKIDPILSKVGILSAKKMCSLKMELSNPMISPLNGRFDQFPRTVLFLAEHDIMYPDELLTVQKMNEANVDFEVIKGEKMPHIWPLLPVMNEAKTALNQLIKRLNQ